MFTIIKNLVNKFNGQASKSNTFPVNLDVDAQPVELESVIAPVPSKQLFLESYKKAESLIKFNGIYNKMARVVNTVFTDCVTCYLHTKEQRSDDYIENTLYDLLYDFVKQELLANYIMYYYNNYILAGKGSIRKSSGKRISSLMARDVCLYESYSNVDPDQEKRVLTILAKVWTTLRKDIAKQCKYNGTKQSLLDIIHNKMKIGANIDSEMSFLSQELESVNCTKSESALESLENKIRNIAPELKSMYSTEFLYKMVEIYKQSNGTSNEIPLLTYENYKYDDSESEYDDDDDAWYDDVEPVEPVESEYEIETSTADSSIKQFAGALQDRIDANYNHDGRIGVYTIKM